MKPMPDNTKQIIGLVAQVSRKNIERDVRYLSTTWANRHTLGRYHAPCAGWLRGRLRAYGVAGADFHEYTMAGKRLRNVIGNKAGKAGEPTLLLCAHFDSRMEDLGNADAPAPGADDNATGVATVLEVARILAPLRLRDSVRFALFSGEEQGLWGSTAYARKVQADKTALRFVFNLDELGYPPPDRALFVDRDEGGESRTNDAAGRALVARIQTLARDMVKVPTRVDPAERSDYVPFEALGYVIAGLYEAGKDYPAYHTTRDTIEKVDFAYVTDMARLTLATVLSEGGVAP